MRFELYSKCKVGGGHVHLQWWGGEFTMGGVHNVRVGQSL